ncbi:MAG: hypothetical protein CL792_01815 [Chloroflexi bacterium]|nr:hypothetical protein [Chloroflexota bacterium]
MLRLRQLCLVTNNLNQIERDLKSIFELDVCHRDPSVEKFGLHNFLMPIGTNFLEVVAPFQENTSAGRYLQKSGGDGGYMIIMQCDDVENAKDRIVSLGHRLILDTKNPDTEGIQIHPKDLPGAIAEFRSNNGIQNVDGPWAPAGHGWNSFQNSGSTDQIISVTIQSKKPLQLASKWSKALDRPIHNTDEITSINLDNATLHFIENLNNDKEGIVSIDLRVNNLQKILSTAILRGYKTTQNSVVICGIRFKLFEES